MTTTETTKYLHALQQRAIDGGYSGSVTITAAHGAKDSPVLVFVDADTLNSRLVLTPDQAAELAAALSDIVKAARA